MTVLAWLLAFASLAAFIVALRIGASVATNAGPYCAAAFFCSWAYLAFHYDRRTP